MAISVGSVEVDVVPVTRGIYARLRADLTGAAGQAGGEAGRIIGERISSQVGSSLQQGIAAGGQQARATAARTGEQTAGSFARAMSARLQAAYRSMPRLEVTLSTTGADADLARLRARLESLSERRVGVDVDADAAMAEIADIEERLRRIGSDHPDIAVRADTSAALAQLAALRAEVDAVDGRDVDVDANVDTGAAIGSLSALTSAAVAFGPAAIPVFASVAAAAGGLAAAFAAAGAGIGALGAVAMPAFSDISGALQAQKAAQEQSTTATRSGGQAASQAASKALQLAGAQQSLAAAERNGARQVAAAQKQVVQARQAAADAAAQAAQRNAQAARAVQDAERQLVGAQKDAKQAQLDLVAARRTAAQQLEDLGTRLVDSQLSQRDAALTVQEAQANLTAVQKAGSKATLLDQQRAQLAYDQAVQRLKEQSTETARLSTQKAAADKAGVEGSDTVKQAQERVAQAQQQVADRARAVRDAQADAARTQVESAKQVAAAQAKIGDATANVAVAQQAAADAVASAQRQIASAQTSTGTSAVHAATAQDKYRAALAAMTPSARQTFNAFVSLRSAFSSWSRSLQPTVMPIFTRALNAMRQALPQLTPLVKSAAGAVRDLVDSFASWVSGGGISRTVAWLSKTAGPQIRNFGAIARNVAGGIGGMLRSFAPSASGATGALVSLTDKFRQWGQSGEGVRTFLGYVRTVGPTVWGLFKSLAGTVVHLVQAFAPLGGVGLKVLNIFADLAESIPVGVLRTVGMIIAASVVGLKLYGFYTTVVAAATRVMAAAQWLLNAAMSASPLTLVILAIAALVAGIIVAYQKVGWFRAAVQAAWEGIKTAALWVWTNVLQPVFNALKAAFSAVAAAAMWLWHNAIKPAFDGIGAAAQWVWQNVIKPVIGFIKWNLRLLGATFSWLYNNIVKPVFDLVAGVFRFLWGVAKAVFGTLVAFVRNVLGPVFKWLYNTIVKPVFGAIAWAVKMAWGGIKVTFNAIKSFIQGPLSAVFRWLRDNVIEPVWNGIKTAIGAVWKYGIKPTFDAVKSAVHVVGQAFEAAKNAIKTAWDKLKDIAKGPVNFIINTVYTHGIKAVWDMVVGAFGGKKLPEVKGLARGGVLPGYSSFRQGDDQLVPMRRGEGVYVSEAMRDPYERARLFAVNKAAIRGQSLQPFQGGFSLGGIFEGIGSVASGAWDKVKAGASWLADTFGGAIKAGARAIVNPLISLIPGDGGFTKVLKDGARNMVDRLLGAGEKGDNLSTPNIDYKAGAGVAQWRPVVLQALREVGQSSALAGSTLRRMNQESGGNPKAVNKWDSNWQAGHPSVGLMQVIGPTFRSYAGKYRGKGPKMYGVSIDPMANIYSSMRYAMSAYGSLSRAYNRAGGYDSGGYLQPGLNLAYNGTGRPEPVFTTQQANALTRMSGLDGGGTPSIGDLDVRVYVGDREITDIARTEVRRNNVQLTNVLRAGRRV